MKAIPMTDLPRAIAEAAEQVTTSNYELAKLQLQVKGLENMADMEVAVDPELKNELQRKARRIAILEEQVEYRNLQEEIIVATQEKQRRENRLELLRNQFSVAKLEARLTIVGHLAGAEGRELLGV